MYIYYGRGSTNRCRKNYHCSINNITELILSFVYSGFFKIFVAHGRKRKKEKFTQKQRDISPCSRLDNKFGFQMSLLHTLKYLILFLIFVFLLPDQAAHLRERKGNFIQRDIHCEEKRKLKLFLIFSISGNKHATMREY